MDLVLNNLAFLAWERGDLAQARAHWEDALADARALGNPWSVAAIAEQPNRGRTEKRRMGGRRDKLREVLPIVRDLGLRSLASQVLQQSSALAAAMGDARGRRDGLAQPRRSSTPSDPNSSSQGRATRSRRVFARNWAPPAFARATAEGAALGYEEALAEAQAWLEDPQRWVHRI